MKQRARNEERHWYLMSIRDAAIAPPPRPTPPRASAEHGNVSLIKRYCAVSDKNISEQLRKYLGRNHQLPGPGYGDENSSWGT